MAIRTSSSTTVRLNAKIESVNFMRLPYLSTAFEGCMLTLNSSGQTALAGTTSSVAYLNFTPAGRSDAATAQKDPFRDDGSNITIETGGLTGICGTGFEVGVPNTDTFWTTVVSASTDIGKQVALAASGKIEAYTLDTATSAGGAITYRYSVGTITRVENGIAYFLFTSASKPLVIIA